MSIAVNSNTDTTNTYTKLGAATGVGASTAYLIKNKEDIFVNRVKESVQRFGNKKAGIITAAIASGVTLLAVTGAGAAIGRVIGSVINKIKGNKEVVPTEPKLQNIPEIKNTQMIDIEELQTVDAGNPEA